MSTIGFTVRIRAIDSKQMLGYWWWGQDGKQLGFETAVGGIGPVTDAEIIAIELEHLAAAIREKDREHRLPKKKKRRHPVEFENTELGDEG